MLGILYVHIKLRGWRRPKEYREYLSRNQLQNTGPWNLRFK